MERTFVLIKPNAIKKQKAGAIIQKFQAEGLGIAGLKMVHVSKALCEEFYKEHRDRPFFKELTGFISSSPVIVMALEGRDAVRRARKLMGDTDPKKAAPGTLRRQFGDSVGENAVHGSDSLSSAKRELALFFPPPELFPGI